MSNNQLIKSVNYKPVYAPYVIGAVGLAFMIGLRQWPAYILGVFCLVMAYVVYKYVEDYKVMDIYDNQLIVYQQNGARQIIPFDSIKEWNVNRTKQYCFYCKDVDNNELLIDTFRVTEIYKTLNTIMPQKETLYLRKERNKFKFSLNNLFKKRKK